MRTIVINARAAARPELGGVERWSRAMARELPRLDAAYVVARPPAALSHRAGHAWEQAILPAVAMAHRAALVLSCANLAPLVCGSRNVVVVHDAAPLRDDGWYSAAYLAAQRRLLPRIVRGAGHVVTVSEFSRRELIELVGVAPERVSVVGPGVEEAFFGARAAPRERPYVLVVASATARKNLRALVPAARRLARAGVDVLVAGGSRPQFAAEPGIDALHLLGYVPATELPGLYAGASALVMPSLYEGFGLPCVEAMAAGVPVVASDRAALPETCGDAALLVDPTDGDALADALERVLGDEALAGRLVEAGRRRVAGMTWAASATAMDRLLRSLHIRRWPLA